MWYILVKGCPHLSESFSFSLLLTFIHLSYIKFKFKFKLINPKFQTIQISNITINYKITLNMQQEKRRKEKIV